jgi:hypothetical protein
MGYELPRRLLGPIIPFSAIVDEIHAYYKKTYHWPDEVFLGSKYVFDTGNPGWKFTRGKILFNVIDIGRPFALTIDETMKPGEIVCVHDDK